MALTDPKDTLAYHSSRVLCIKRDMSEVPCSNVAKALGKYQHTHSPSDEGHSTPETQALWFYGMNHGMALISKRFHPLEPLPPHILKFVEAYHDNLVPRAVRAFYYLLLICTREARHNKSLNSDHKKLMDKFGLSVADFFVHISGGESSIHQKFVTNPPTATIGQYVEALRWQFYNSKWNSGYGGPAWGRVTDCLCRFVTGEYSAEMMLDTIWTLAHNNGPIFNKGIFYGHYNMQVLIRILDVQRSGQIPQAILFDQPLWSFVPNELTQWMKTLKEWFPEDIGDYVAWDMVEALGSVQKYPNEKKAQWAKHGLSPLAKEAEKAAYEKKIKEQEEFNKKWFMVTPTTKVKKIQMVRAA